MKNFKRTTENRATGNSHGRFSIVACQFFIPQRRTITEASANSHLGWKGLVILGRRISILVSIQRVLETTRGREIR